jgi:hypothetical protein
MHKKGKVIIHDRKKGVQRTNPSKIEIIDRKTCNFIIDNGSTILNARLQTVWRLREFYMVLFLNNLIATLDGEGWSITAEGINLKTLGSMKVEHWKDTIGKAISG